MARRNFYVFRRSILFGEFFDNDEIDFLANGRISKGNILKLRRKRRQLVTLAIQANPGASHDDILKVVIDAAERRDQYIGTWQLFRKVLYPSSVASLVRPRVKR